MGINKVKRNKKKNPTRLRVTQALFLFLSLFTGIILQAQTTQTSGISILDIGNKRDIYDQRNRQQLLELKQEAVIDAIEKAAAISISVRSELNTIEQEIGGHNAFSEQFVNNILQRYNVKWTRNSGYEFERDPERKRIWICRVSGVVELGSTYEADIPGELAKLPFVRAKQGKKIYCTDGTDIDLKVGQKIEIVKQRPVSAGSGSIMTDKVVGRAVVTETQDRSATAEIVSGRYGIKDGYLIRPADFPIVAGGVKIGFYFADQRVGIKETGNDTLHKISGISIDYFELSLTKHYGVIFGVDLISDKVSDTLSLTSAIFRLGLFRPVNIIPEYFYITPSLSFGYATLSEEYALSESGKFAM